MLVRMKISARKGVHAVGMEEWLLGYTGSVLWFFYFIWGVGSRLKKCKSVLWITTVA